MKPKPTKQTNVLDNILLQLMKEQPNGIRLTDFEKILQDRLVSRGVTDYFQVGSRHTIIELLKPLQKQGYATKDIDSRRYVITSHGEQHLDKLGVVKHILSSDYWIPDFLWSPTSKEPAMEVYNMVQGKEDGKQCTAILKGKIANYKINGFGATEKRPNQLCY